MTIASKRPNILGVIPRKPVNRMETIIANAGTYECGSWHDSGHGATPHPKGMCIFCVASRLGRLRLKGAN